LLLEAGADPNDSQTMYNCGPGCPPPYDDDHLELLLEFGLGQGDGGPWHERMTTAHPTPAQLLEDELVFASSAGLLHRVQLLLAKGVDPEGQGTRHPAFRGHRPYELAAVNGHDQVAELLLEAGVEPLDDVHLLFAAAMNGNRAEVARLTARDSGLAQRAVARDPYLTIRAGELGNVAALQLLADLGFDVNVFALAAPLHRAALNGHLDAVKKLIQLGADPTFHVRRNATGLGRAQQAAGSRRLPGRVVADLQHRATFVGAVRAVRHPGPARRVLPDSEGPP
jgi:hypothetical protein